MAMRVNQPVISVGFPPAMGQTAQTRQRASDERALAPRTPIALPTPFAKRSAAVAYVRQLAHPGRSAPSLSPASSTS